MKNKILRQWIKSRPGILAYDSMIADNLELMAKIDDDALQKKFLNDLIRNYVFLEKKLDTLLKNTLPTTVAEEIKMEGKYPPRLFSCTILFTDFIDFTKLAEIIPRDVLVETLNTIFTEFDEKIEYYEGTKIKTMGDAYMAIFGAPVEYADHAIKGIRMALSMIQCVQRFNLKTAHPFHMRVGIHSGKVMAGVIGKERMQFDVFGDDVNIASRFESSGVKNRINVSETTYLLAKNHFLFEKRGTIALKNKKDMTAYFVLGEK